MTERKIKCDICHQAIDETGYVVFRQDGGYPFDDSTNNARATAYELSLQRIKNATDRENI